MNDKELQEVGQKVAKRGRGRPPGTGGNERPDCKPQTDPGDNSKYIGFALLLHRLPPVDMSNNEQVTQRVDEYFQLCADNDMKPGMAGLALAFGYDRRSLWEFINGKRAKNQDVADTLKKASEILDIMMETYMQNGKINPVSGIFLMKNNLGYTDKQEVVITPQSPLGDQKDTKAIEEKYRDSIGE